MDQPPAHPWFESAVQRLGVRRGHRLLAIAPTGGEALALRGLLGRDGELTVTVTSRAVAERLAERADAGMRVLLHEVGGDERFGSYDALLVAPRTWPGPTADRLAALARRNLRPGGRFVIDLPAPDMVPDLRSAWRQLGWDEERLLPLTGPDDVALSEELREQGLRGVTPALGSHLLRVASAADLVASFADALGLDEHESPELTHAVVRHRADAGPLEVLVHRTQVTGQR